MTNPADAADQPAPEPAPVSASAPLDIAWLPGTYAVCRLNPASPIPAWAAQELANPASKLISITRTIDEVSIVASEHIVPDDVRIEPGWAACRIVGTLDFSMVGILARLTTALADAGISVFGLSTFDTDYLLVKAADKPPAAEVLRSA